MPVILSMENGGECRLDNNKSLREMLLRVPAGSGLL
jgi:hypothetical protein